MAWPDAGIASVPPPAMAAPAAPPTSGGLPEVVYPEEPMLGAVQADLAEIDIGKVPGGRTYQAVALWLARVIDKRGSEDGPSTTAKLANELTSTMAKLTRRDGDGADESFERFSDSLSVPVVVPQPDPPKARPATARRRARG